MQPVTYFCESHLIFARVPVQNFKAAKPLELGNDTRPLSLPG